MPDQATQYPMQTYKITFVKNSIASCKLANDVELKENVEVQKHKGFLIHALVRAENEADARLKAQQLIKENT